MVAAFEETQPMARWVVYLLVVSGVPVPLVLGTTMGFDGLLVGIGVWLLPAVIFHRSRLETEITTGSMRIRFVPFHRRPRTISLHEIETATQVSLNPNPGVGWTRDGWQYQADGTEAIELERAADTLVVGTQRPTALLAALERQGVTIE